MSIHQLKNIFSQEELDSIQAAINSVDIPIVDGEYIDHVLNQNEGIGIHKELGRIQFGGISNIDSINKKILNIVNELSPVKLSMRHVISVEYSGKYGQPVLPPHFDHDTNDLVVDFQLSANTSWDLGVDTKNYEMSDNSALIFNANEHIHWRPHKTFKEGEYVRMVFWRFYDESKPSDYSHLDYVMDHEVLKETNDFRDSLGWS